ncbi:fimbria/pilus periplasmic chaperone [Salmonella enterica]|nr:fimbria/pilus periplasmic chaperone [Salmonella enterica]
MNINNKMKTSLLTVCLIGLLQPAYAAVSLDRTRAIFKGTDKSITLNISNENKQLPYLAQAWLEDSQEKKITAGALVVTPPVQRLEPGAKGLVRISGAAAKSLPQDRESLFYFNLREIPPKSDKPNVLQIALQTRIKLFYRPESIVQAPGAVWQDQLILVKENNGYRLENPTPYYITVIGLGGTKEQAEKGQFDPVMIAPKENVSVKSTAFSVPYLTYIDDYGGRPTLKFQCDAGRCTAQGKA